MESQEIKNKRKVKSLTQDQLLTLGKLPPQATDLEMAVLGALMQDPNAVTKIIDILTPETFYLEKHQVIFSAIKNIFERAEPVDILVVIQELKRTNTLEISGGAVYVTNLTNNISSSANTEVHARIVIQKYIQRELIRISTDTLQKSYEDSSDVFELLEYAEQNIFSISNTTIKKTFEHIKQVLLKTIQEIESAKNQEFSGIPSGFTSLDKITGGWHKSDLIIISARPGAGKTAFAMTVARNASVEFKKPVAIFSLEMSSTQLVSRLISSEAEIEADKLRNGEIKEDQWSVMHSKIANLAEAPIYIDDTPSLSIFEFRAKARRLKQQHDVAMIIVDYLQLMVSNESRFSREQEVSLISRSLKAIAKELDIPIIALCQMSRSVEQRGGAKRPQLSDLRESGAIEQDADVVMFIYRPWICGIQEDEEGNSTEGMAEIIIAKHRNGKIDSAKLAFVDHFAKFSDIEAPMHGFKPSTPYEKPTFSDNEPPLKVEPNHDFLNQGPNTDHSFDI